MHRRENSSKNHHYIYAQVLHTYYLIKLHYYMEITPFSIHTTHQISSKGKALKINQQ